MSQIDLLFRLQQTDDEIREKKRRLAEVVRRQRESDALAAARQRAEEAAAGLHEWHGRQKDLELELTGLKDKAKRSENRLYSGLVKNPKELEDLQQELESLKRRRMILEDELLETMIMAEEAETEVSEVDSELAEIEAHWERDQGKLKQEQHALVERVNELAGMRKQQLEMISPQYQKVYETTLHRVGPTAVVKLRNDRCSGCQVGVPANRIKAVDEGQLVYCDSCGRILALV